MHSVLTYEHVHYGYWRPKILLRAKHIQTKGLNVGSMLILLAVSSLCDIALPSPETIHQTGTEP